MECTCVIFALNINSDDANKDKMSIEITTCFESPLGLIEINVSDDAISCISFIERKKSTMDKHPLLIEAVLQLEQYFKSERIAFDLPIKQTGTDFQLRVWNELVAIPFGKTMSYLQLSKKLGHVKAIRAVGTTNGKNKIAIVVPCHRVIGTDGSLTGYAGGLWRKQWLLEHESNLISRQQKLF